MQFFDGKEGESHDKKTFKEANDSAKFTLQYLLANHRN